MIIAMILVNIEIEEVSGHFCFNRAFNTKNLTCNDFGLNPFVLVDRDLSSLKFLVPRLAEFVFCIEVDPELEAKCCFVKAGWNLRVHDTLSGGHPLDIPWSNHSCMTLKIFVRNLPSQHVSDCLETAMGMIGESGWQGNIEEIQHQEWVKSV